MTTKEELIELLEEFQKPYKLTTICKTILSIFLLPCIVYLIMNGQDGWGWLVLLLFCIW